MQRFLKDMFCNIAHNTVASCFHLYVARAMMQRNVAEVDIELDTIKPAFVTYNIVRGICREGHMQQCVLRCCGKCYKVCRLGLQFKSQQ